MPEYIEDDETYSATQLELGQQAGFKVIIKYDPIRRAFMARLPIMNPVPITRTNYESADEFNKQL